MGFLSKLFGLSGSSSERRHGSRASGRELLCRRIESIVENEFDEYELRTDIPASELCASYGARNYSYGIYKDDSLRVLIMIMRDNNDYRKKDVCLSHEAAYLRGVPCLNFMPHLPNEEEYISNRLHENIAG